MLKILLQSTNIQVNAEDNLDNTALSLARYKEVAAAIIVFYYDINHQNNSGSTAFNLAIENDINRTVSNLKNESKLN